MRFRNVLKSLVVNGFALVRPIVKILGLETWFKNQYELMYWRMRKRREGILNNENYRNHFTTLVDLDEAFYEGKRILDIGCGPRGSLEWADMVLERVGLDPLVDAYRDLGIDQHAMTYVNAPSEKIPFPDSYFDVVSSINSLDHVDDLDKTVSEIIRVTAKGGCFLLIVEINHEATIAEPHMLEWNVVEKFSPMMTSEYEKHYEQNPAAPGAVASAQGGIPFDHQNPERRPGGLVARLIKV